MSATNATRESSFQLAYAKLSGAVGVVLHNRLNESLRLEVLQRAYDEAQLILGGRDTGHANGNCHSASHVDGCDDPPGEVVPT